MYSSMKAQVYQLKEINENLVYKIGLVTLDILFEEKYIFST